MTCPRCRHVVEFTKAGYPKPHNGPQGKCLAKGRCGTCGEVVYLADKDGTAVSHKAWSAQEGRVTGCPGVGRQVTLTDDPS